jgi:hypothetical protein
MENTNPDKKKVSQNADVFFPNICGSKIRAGPGSESYTLIKNLGFRSGFGSASNIIIRNSCRHTCH